MQRCVSVAFGPVLPAHASANDVPDRVQPCFGLTGFSRGVVVFNRNGPRRTTRVAPARKVPDMQQAQGHGWTCICLKRGLSSLDPLADVFAWVQLVPKIRETRMERYGALVGWGHLINGNRLMLRLESFRSRDALDERDLDDFRILLTKQQALLLGNYLIKLSEHSAIGQKQGGWFRRRLG